jgi:hypothetical protein
MTVDEFMVEIGPELAQQVDTMILAQAELQDRLLLMRHRERILREYTRATELANLRYRLAQAEERQRPHLVHDGEPA